MAEQKTRELSETLDLLVDEAWQRRAAEEVLVLLASPEGQELLQAQLAFAAGNRDVRFGDWSIELEHKGQDFRALYGERIQQMLQALFPEYEPEAGDDGEVDPREVVEKLLAGLGALTKENKLIAQLVEVLDDAGLIKQVAKDGAIASMIVLILSARTNSKAYQQGAIRWDDALDNVALDTVKAGITGIIVSAMVGGLAGVSAGGSLALAIPLAIVVHAAVSAFCDATYEHLLGGRLIREARSRHSSYIEVASYIRNQLYPLLERAEALGLLVELAGELQDDPKAREVLVDEAVKIISTLRGRTTILARGDRTRSQNLEVVLREYLADKGAETELSVAEIEDLAAVIHKLYWDQMTRAPNHMLNHELVMEELRLSIRHDSLVKHLVELESKRTRRDLPLRFRCKVTCRHPRIDKLPQYVFASDMVEMARFVSMLRDETWGCDFPTPELRVRSIAVDARYPYRVYTGQENAYDLEAVRERYLSWDRPFTHDDWNPCFRMGFARELAQGDWRLFRLDVSDTRRPHYRYLAIPSARGRKRTEAIDEELLRRSLREDHPYFRNLRAKAKAMRSVTELDVPEYLESAGGTFAAMGCRCVALERYTATFMFQDRDGSMRFLSQEGFFNSLYEAYAAFESKLSKHELIGVRPGGLVLPDPLRTRLQEATPDQFWSLQRELISQVSSGLMMLDQLANNAEERIQALAGAGVVISAWWFLNGQTRRELVGLLQNSQVQQSLRLELMEALLVLQRIHASNRLVSGDSPRERVNKHIEDSCRDEQRRLIAGGVV
jgi:hypothetical protein